ncbi:MAG: ABC transporter substrate-binding protein [Pseudomonadota bacterium]|nr:ABC transporter substrate-binding protein [Pseudomonadota bacterium]
MTSALGAPAAFAQERGPRDAQAEQFVEANGVRVLAILNNRQESKAVKEQTFRALIDQIFDVPRVTHFVLGKYARSITPEQYQRFAAVFRQYVEAVYQSRIDDYHGEKFTVNGSVIRKPGDVIVTTSLFGGKMSSPTVVQWRVLGGPGNFRVVDVQVRGVWLAITQQQDFVSTVDNAGGNINVLIAQLQNDNNGTVHHKG